MVLRRGQAGFAQRNTLLVGRARTGPHRKGHVLKRSNFTANSVNVDYFSTGGDAPRAAAGLSWFAGKPCPTGWSWPASWSWPAGLP